MHAESNMQDPNETPSSNTMLPAGEATPSRRRSSQELRAPLEGHAGRRILKP